jgi:hypothetical protein
LSTPFVQEFEEIDGTTMANSLHGSRSRTRRSNSARQLTIVPRGGARPGAGRKPKGERALVSHAKRTAVTPREPVLITTKLVAGLPNVRRESSLAVLREALAAARANTLGEPAAPASPAVSGLSAAPAASAASVSSVSSSSADGAHGAAVAAPPSPSTPRDAS